MLDSKLVYELPSELIGLLSKRFGKHLHYVVHVSFHIMTRFGLVSIHRTAAVIPIGVAFPNYSSCKKTSLVSAKSYLTSST